MLDTDLISFNLMAHSQVNVVNPMNRDEEIETQERLRILIKFPELRNNRSRVPTQVCPMTTLMPSHWTALPTDMLSVTLSILWSNGKSMALELLRSWFKS